MKTLSIETVGKTFLIECQPCPFCGGEHLTDVEWWDDDGEFPAVSCLDCKAEAPASTWNTRAKGA